MTARLTKLKVSNFRSISGTIDLELDAPVVLIYGPNGSGKTSLLSAIELGLTGAVASLRRFDEAYMDNLVHRDADEGFISIACRHPSIPGAPSELKLRDGTVSGTPLLNAEQGRFFTERSFLAQATLGRLLEIYESADAREGQNPLTRFVKDLLGLDALDNLIAGLHPAGDKRRLRRSLPLYADAETRRDHLKKEVDSLTEEAARADAAWREANANFSAALEPLTYDSKMALDDLIKELRDAKNQEALAVELGELSREITSALSLWDKADTASAEAERSAAEAELSEARKEFSAWNETDGPLVRAALKLADDLVAELPSARSVGRKAACEAASNEVDREIQRISARLTRDQSARKGKEKSQKDRDRAKARCTRLDQRLETLSSQSGALASVLSELVPHVENNVCPVCDRDFSEVSETSLQAHLSSHIALLSRAAAELQELLTERRAAQNAIAEDERAIENYNANIFDDAERTALRARLASLEEAKQRLEGVASLAKAGDEAAARVDAASARLDELRQNQENLAGIRASTTSYLTRLNLPPATDDMATRDILLHCRRTVIERQAESRKREENRLRALNAAQSLKNAVEQKKDADTHLIEARRQAQRAENALTSADDVRRLAKTLSDRAIQTRTDIVRQVFNESLNAVWSDLFIRLAPEEPFIPMFALPAVEKGPVEAELKTRYRESETGGNPRAMLSAGNLNTAALTLFLSLHLSVKPLLPWLVIDDPVQSMDEIHITQFAALLRSLSKQRDRQIIIAVHEKPLFEYLALELSPASDGDRLITVELSRNATGSTSYEYDMKSWNPERVFKAALG